MPAALLPFWCYYGGKWRSSPRYQPPLHSTIIEPFAGAAGYSLRWHWRRVVLVEKDPTIAEMWRWLISATPENVLALPLAIPTTVKDLSLPPGPSALIGFWLNKGAASPCQTPSSWMRQGLHDNSFWGNVVRQRIADQVPAIKHWTILEGSYDESPDIFGTWFIDPPYQRAGVHYRKNKIDYSHLGGWCARRSGQVIVCEEAGADWMPFRILGNFKANESRNGGKKSAEVVWESHPQMNLFG